MKVLLSVCVVSLAFSIAANGNEYRGHVGKLEAVFVLDWHEDGTVIGVYSYPARPGTTYRLAGQNPSEGYLVLDEYTGNDRSARCELSKNITETHIVWQGKMFNTDGRVLEMSFNRLRSVTRKPEVMADELPPVEFGNPPVPDDLEERLAEAERRAATLIEGDGLDAHLFGELHYGWVAPGRLS